MTASPSTRASRRWDRIGWRGRTKAVRQNDTGHMRRWPSAREEAKARADLAHQADDLDGIQSLELDVEATENP